MQWSPLQDYSGANTFLWNAPPGSYQLRAKIHIPSIAGFEASSDSDSYDFTVQPDLTHLQLSIAPANNITTSSRVTLTANVDTFSDNLPLEYQFLVVDTSNSDPTSVQWKEVQPYSASNICTWTPPGPGHYSFTAFMRHQNARDWFEVSDIAQVNVNPTTPTITAVWLAAAPTPCVTVNTPITLRVFYQATGNVNPTISIRGGWHGAQG